VCTIVDGKVHIVSAGDCTVTASQANNANYGDATAQQVYTIKPEDPDRQLTANNKVYDGGVSATVTKIRRCRAC
jgi:hypothetical protein